MLRELPVIVIEMVDKPAPERAQNPKIKMLPFTANFAQEVPEHFKQPIMLHKVLFFMGISCFHHQLLLLVEVFPKLKKEALGNTRQRRPVGQALLVIPAKAKQPIQLGGNGLMGLIHFHNTQVPVLVPVQMAFHD
jgi:hypothetical protein